MAKERKPADNSPLMPPVKRITLNEGNNGAKKVIIIVLIIIALSAFSYAVSQFLKGEDGWQTVTVNSQGFDVSSEVTLEYNYTGLSAAGRKKLTLVYSEASENAYAFFNESQHVEGKTGLYDISASVGKEVEVDEALYKALETVEKYKSRALYLAPIYAVYSDLFFCQDDSEARQFDPLQNSETAEYISKVLTFVSDEKSINLELLGNNTVKLNVSDEYLDFAKENKIDYFLDFYWLKNAFIVDYIADTVTSEGFKNGYVSSIDGFSRRMDDSDEQFSLNLTNRNKNAVVISNTVEYKYPLSAVVFSSYPVSNAESFTDKYYLWSDGRITTPFIDVKDGMCKSSVPELICISEKLGCGEIALSAMDYFISDTFDEDGVCRKLCDETGIVSFYWDEDGFVSTSPAFYQYLDK